MYCSSNYGGNHIYNISGRNLRTPFRKGIIVFAFCGYSGNTKEKCYKLMGYPPNWSKVKKKTLSQFSNQVGCKMSIESQHQTSTSQAQLQKMFP